MATLHDPQVRVLLDAPNHAVVCTLNADGTVHSTVVWQALEGETLLVNSAVGRVWPANLERDPRVTVLVYDQSNPYEYVEVRGTAAGSTAGADEVIDRLTQKFLGQDVYPFRQPGEQRITFAITPERVRYQSQG